MIILNLMEILGDNVKEEEDIEEKIQQLEQNKDNKEDEQNQ